MGQQQEKYRLTHYRLNAWQIDQYKEIVNPRTKESRWGWVTVKYPGNLKNAAKMLLGCYIGQGAYDSIIDLMNELKRAEQAVVESVDKLDKRKKIRIIVLWII